MFRRFENSRNGGVPVEIVHGNLWNVLNGVQPVERLERFELFQPYVSEAVERLERLELVAAWVSNMPDMPRQKMAVGARHRLYLRASFSTQQGRSSR